MKRKVIQITITEACNLNCIYCYEKNKDFRKMEISLAKSIIKDSFSQSDSNDILEFDFHEGEIALAFTEIKTICEWAWGEKWNNEYIFHATTNGTLIHGEIKQWFAINSHRFSLGLSLDGTEEMHNINRSNSYSLIDLDFFRKSWPNQTVKMTISPKTISMADKGIIDIVNKGFKLTANLAYGQIWDGIDLRNQYRKALSRLVDFYLENPHLEVCNLVSLNLSTIGKNILLNRPRIHNKWCGAGQDMKCYSIDGTVYPCQMFNPSSNKIQDLNILNKIDIVNIPVEDCDSCALLPSCPSCYGYNFIINGKISKSPDELCDFRKLEALASSFLFGKMLQTPSKYMSTKNMNEAQIACTILGIDFIQKEFGKLGNIYQKA